MKVIGIVPARYKSSRFPGKPLVDILGTPLVQRVYERALKSKRLSKVYVATEDERIEALCRAKGMNVIMTSDRHPTGTDRVAEAARTVAADVYVNIQGDEPLIDPGSIDAAIAGFLAFPARTVSCLMKRIDSPAELHSVNVPKVAINDKREVVFFSRLAIPFPKGGADPDYYKQVCVYAFSKKSLGAFARLPRSRNERVEDIELLRFVDNGIPVKMIEVFKNSAAVDVPGDVKTVCALLKRARARA